VGSIEWIAYTLLSFSICCLAALDYKDAVVLTPTQYRITVTIYGVRIEHFFQKNFSKIDYHI
jgi:hypothetical protein